GHNATVHVVNAATGDIVGNVPVHGQPAAIALTSHFLAVLLDQGGPYDRVSRHTTSGSKRLGSLLVSVHSAPQLAVNNHLIVFRVFSRLNGIPLQGGRIRTLAKTSADYTVGLSLANGRLLWAVNHGQTGRLRALSVR